MRNSLKSFCALLFIFPGLMARGAVSSQSSQAVEFDRDIHPIFSDICFKCHGPDEEKRKGKLRLDTKEGAYSQHDGHAAVVPGDLTKSEAWRRVNAAGTDDLMPPAKSGMKLTQEQIKTLGDWIKQGAKYTAHWSFVPPVEPALPKVKQKSWPKNQIDYFVLAKLEEEKLHPSREADKATLLRRVTLDLTGLPPTPAELDAFLKDKNKDAYEKVVDRLLASPHYGERMAVEWLDAARYADTHGYHIDSGRDMTRWRQWVIDAFNQNKPFDQFTVEQLAGDLLPHATLDQKIASGFNRNNMINFEGGAIPEEYHAQYVIDRVNTTGTVWLGLTVGCAQCHDHKYDPITQKDFYRLFAFFNNVPEKGLDGAHGNAEPILPVGTPEQNAKVAELKAATTEAEAKLKAVEEQAAAAQQKWEEEQKTNLPPASTNEVIVSTNEPAAALPSPPVVAANANLNTPKPPPLPNLPSAADQFGAVLALPPTARSGQLTNSSAEIRKRILAKLQNYDAAIRSILATPPHQRTKKQDKDLKEYFRKVRFPQWAKADAAVNAAQKAETEYQKNMPTTMVMVEDATPHDTHVLLRGQYDHLGEKVTAGLPHFLAPNQPDHPMNRLDLAQWIVSPEQPLTARVIVNRYWQMYFGTGIVKTVEDFGAQGEWPSHIELLDWLATEFVHSGWDVKKMQKLIVMSATYRQESEETPEMAVHDPENRLLERGPRFRLQAEFIRDQALAVSGLLNDEIAGKSVYPYQPAGLWEELMSRDDGSNWTAQVYVQSHGADLYRRTMYTFWKRTSPPPTLSTFDAPDRQTCTVRRPRTNTPLQALILMNDPTYLEASRKLAERMMENAKDSDDRIAYAYRLVLARAPHSAELGVLLKLYQKQLARYHGNTSAALKLLSVGESPRNDKLATDQLAAWTMVASAILNLDETLTKG